MSNIVEKLKENQFNDVENSNIKCPVCNSYLYIVSNWMNMVLDGNTIYHCENVKEHRIWHHPFEEEFILHLNKNATETDWTTEQDFKIINDSWTVC